MPYFISVVGMDKFGLISVAQAFMSYFIILTDYGFNLNSTREISQNRHNLSKVSELVNRTLITKSFLSIVGFCLIVLCTTFIPFFSKHAPLYYFSFAMVWGQVLTPTWFFQGIEQMKYLTWLNLTGKISFALLILLFIRLPEQYIYINLLYGLGNMASGIVGLCLIYKKFGVRFQVPADFNLRKELKEGWNVFLSGFAINAYMNSNILILSFFVNERIVGYYGIAEKVILAVRQLLTVFFHTTFPQVCRKVLQGHQELVLFFRQFFIPFFVLIIAGSCLLLAVAPYITLFLTDEDVPLTTQSIRLLSIVPVIVCINIPAYQTLLAYNLQKGYMPVLLLGSLINVLLNSWWAGIWGIWGTVWNVIVTEIFITIGLHITLQFKYPDKALFNSAKKKHNY